MDHSLGYYICGRPIGVLPVCLFACLSGVRVVEFGSKVQQICGLTGTEAILTSAQFHWVGLQAYGRQSHFENSLLEHVTRSLGGQRKRYKDTLNSNMTACDMQANNLETPTADRSSWRTLFKKQVSVTCKTSAFNARSVIDHRPTSALRVTFVVTSARQELTSSLTDEHVLRDLEIRRVDGSFQSITSLFFICPFAIA